MQISENGLALIKRFEGLRLEAYRDSVGVLTIGYGSTGADVYPGMTITAQQAEELLLQDVHRFERAVNRLVTVPVNQNEFDALISFTFNLGAGALEGSTLLSRLNAEDRSGSAGQFPRWRFAGGRELAGLVRRREAEKELFLTPAVNDVEGDWYSHVKKD